MWPVNLAKTVIFQDDLTHMSETLVLTTRWGAVTFVHVTSLTLSHMAFSHSIDKHEVFLYGGWFPRMQNQKLPNPRGINPELVQWHIDHILLVKQVRRPEIDPTP